MEIGSNSIAVVIPCYNVEKHIRNVVTKIPAYISGIFLVNDGSTDSTKQVMLDLEVIDKRVVCLSNEKNTGVGGAVITGFKEALNRDYDFIIKIDGDEQMDPLYFPELLAPLLSGEFQFSKGNRFSDFDALKKMPFIRRIGNLFLSFLIKAASGYWSVFDPTNGFFCIRKDVLKKVDFRKLDKRYFFESSFLIELYYTGARIIDIPIPAKYGLESSHLSVIQTLLTFPWKLLKAYLRRFILRYFLYDFSIFSIYLMIGFPLFLFGIIFGIIKWISYASANITAPTGTVMLATLSVVLGFQLLLSVIQYDISSENPFASRYKNHR